MAAKPLTLKPCFFFILAVFPFNVGAKYTAYFVTPGCGIGGYKRSVSAKDDISSLVSAVIHFSLVEILSHFPLMFSHQFLSILMAFWAWQSQMSYKKLLYVKTREGGRKKTLIRWESSSWHDDSANDNSSNADWATFLASPLIERLY